MSQKILVVDDESDVELLINQRFRKKIKENEVKFYFAGNGEQALEILNNNADIDVVLTDINMPVMDGLVLLTKIDKLNSQVMAIIVSAYGDMDNIRQAMNLGAFDFITKPINFEDLDCTLNKSFKVLTRTKIAQKEHNELVNIQQELSIAREIQQSILPSPASIIGGLKGHSLYAQIIPAKEVGGDFYDFFYIDDEHLGICIADVSGKGIPAALFMTMSKTLLKASALRGLSPGICLEYVNKFISQDNEACMFVTVFYGVLNLITGEFCYSNGGHNYPYIINSNGNINAICEANGGHLGTLINKKFIEEKMTLHEGDTIFLFTDGVTEAMNANSDLFSENRLEEILTHNYIQKPHEICQSVLDGIKKFVLEAPQSDDIAIVVMHLNKLQ